MTDLTQTPQPPNTAVQPTIDEDYRCLLIEGRTFEQVHDHIWEQMERRLDDLRPLSEQRGVTITAFVDRSVFAAEVACQADGQDCAVLFSLESDMPYLLGTGREVLNAYDEGAPYEYVQRWLAQLPLALSTARLNLILAWLERAKTAGFVVYLLQQFDAVVAGAKPDIDYDLVNRLVDDLAEISWAIDVPSGDCERIMAVFHDGSAIMEYDGQWWHEHIEDVWLGTFGVDAEADLTEEQKQTFLEYRAALKIAQASCQADVAARLG